MTRPVTTTPSGWFAFELSILHRLKFKSAAIPLVGDPAIGLYLKRRNVTVFGNDVLQSDWYRSLSVIQNNGVRLSDDDINIVLLDIYVPGFKLRNPALTKWFSEIDAWWFDNARRNIEQLDSPVKFALAAALIMAVGDYVHSFDEETRDLRQPLSNVFRHLWLGQPEPGATTTAATSCSNKSIDDFVAEATADLMFLRLPPAEFGASVDSHSAWREEWIRESGAIWDEVTSSMGLGRPVETKSQYIRMLDETLGRASHLRQWAVSHIETGFISGQEIAEVIGKHRAVEAIYTKDYSELTGKKAVMITA